MIDTPKSNAKHKDLDDYKSILIIKLSALGDMMQAMGVFKHVRHVHPRARITLMTTKGFKSLAEDCGYFDDIYIDQRPKWWNIPALISLRKFMKKGCNGKGFERVYDLQNNDRTKGYFRLSPTQTEWVGTAKGASHHDPANKKKRREGHIFDTLRHTLSHGGLTDIAVDPLDWMKGDVRSLNLPEKFIIIVAGCAPTRPEKRWVTERYIALAHHIHKTGYTPVLIGTDAEKDITSAIAQGCDHALDLSGKTSLYDIAELGRKATATIGNDTGPMHILGPVGCPCAIMYPSSSNAVRYKALGAQIHTLQKDTMNDITLGDALTLLNQAMTN